jgi:hypothetical protein
MTTKSQQNVGTDDMIPGVTVHHQTAIGTVTYRPTAADVRHRRITAITTTTDRDQ